jgi:ribose transport system substrate-binding protein
MTRQRAAALLTAAVVGLAGCSGTVATPSITPVPTFRPVTPAPASAAPASAASASAAPASAAPASAAARTYKFDFHNWTENSPYAHSITTVLQEKVLPKVPYVQMKFYNGNGDAQTQQANVDLMIADKPDMILFYPAAASAGAGAAFKAAGQKCVSINVFTDGCEYFNLSNQAIGTDTANILGPIAKTKGWNASNTTVVIGNNSTAPPEINNCVTYFYSTIAPYLGMQTVDPASIKADTTTITPTAFQFDTKSQTEPAFKAMLNAAPNIKTPNVILYTVNNDATNGAWRALTQAGFTDDHILIGGLGGDASGIKAVRTTGSPWAAEGDIFYAYWGIYFTAMAIAILNGSDPPQITASPQLILTQANVDQYHQAGSDTELTKLPPLVPDNQYLAESPASLAFLQAIEPKPEGLPAK